MAKEKRKQHYVPKFYLKLFTNSDKKFWSFDLNKGKMIENPVYYETQCYDEYFYGKDLVWEKRLSDLEGKWSTSIREALSENQLSVQDEISLKEFVIYQNQRTNSFNNHITQDRRTFLMESAKMLYQQRGWAFDTFAEEMCNKRAQESTTPAENVELATRMVDYISDLKILIVKYHTLTQLITSDSPVIVLNAFLKYHGFGYGCIGIVFLVPLLPNDLLMVYDSKFYKDFNNLTYYHSEDEKEVENINKYQIIGAERNVYSKDNNTFELINEDILSIRRSKIDKPQTLGPEGNKMIVSQAKGVGYYYELPYLKYSREYKKIPEVCREPLPREYEPGWDEKLSLKYDVMNMIIKIDASNIGSISKTDIKLGCKKMKHLAEIYWGI